MSLLKPVSSCNVPETLPQRANLILSRLRHQMGVGSRVLFCLWLFLMILIPHIVRLGDRSTLLLALSLAIAVQATLVLSILCSGLGGPVVLRIFLSVMFFAWLSEVIGVNTGFPFGHYAYTDALQPQIGNVPVQVPAAWLMMLPPAWAVGTIITVRRFNPAHSRKLLSKAVISLTSGLAFSAWDLFLDPQMVAWKLWRWEAPGSYFGIPLINFLGWTLIAATLLFGLSSFIKTEALPVEALLLVYTTSWLLESVGLGLFFGLPGAAAAGFVGMGLFVAPAWTKVLARPT